MNESEFMLESLRAFRQGSSLGNYVLAYSLQQLISEIENGIS